MNDNIKKEPSIEQIMSRLYTADNKTVQKSINVENGLYQGLKEIEPRYNATISDLVNACIEFYVSENEIVYYPKPPTEIAEYRSFMIRQENLRKLQEIKNRTGIGISRLINLSIKKVLDIKINLET